MSREHSRKIHTMAPKSLNFITGNKNKLAEVQAILTPTGVKLSNQSIDLPELQGTIEEISLAKCEQAAKVVCRPIPHAIPHTSTF